MPETCRDARNNVEDLLFDNNTKSFYPLDSLRNYFELKKVKEILSCSCTQCREDVKLFGNQADVESYAEAIVGKGHDPSDSRKTYFSVFGLLIAVEHPLFIIGFLDRNCSDFMLESWTTDATSFSRERLQRYTGKYSQSSVKFERFARKFLSNLPSFAVPHMESERFLHYDSNVILPFIEEEEIGKRFEDGRWTSEGANGKVFAFKIYPEYRKFPGTSVPTVFVRKQIETSQPQADLERSNIQHVQQFGDDHIVKLIKAYGHGESINLILPKAWTNLDHLLRDKAFRYGEKRGVKLELADAWKQLLGISKALKRIQGFGDGADSRAGPDIPQHLCIHYDLKPDNILINSEFGNWVITDFGQAALTQRRLGATPRVGGHFGTDAYAPPEIESYESGRSYDIWSLGCIFLEVTAFLVDGYAGLKGSAGLDRARRAMPEGSRNIDERFFCQELPNGRYVVKREILDFMESLEKRDIISTYDSEESKTFLAKILDLIRCMLEPDAKKRVDISGVVRTLSSALKSASAVASGPSTHQVVPAQGEIVLGGPQLNQIRAYHWSTMISDWEASFLEALENEAGYIRLHCWSRGREPMDIIFPRKDVQMLSLYAFWDPNHRYPSGPWIKLALLGSERHAELPNTMFSFDGNYGLQDARIVQSKLTSQNVMGSFSLGYLQLNKPTSLINTGKGIMRKFLRNEREAVRVESERSMEFGSATVQIWTEEEDIVARDLKRRQSIASRTTTRTARQYQGDQQKIAPCRVAIYLHQQRFICTIKIDVNWKLEESPTDGKILFFKPHPSGQNRRFYASWIRPTQEELNAGYPAGIPLSPKILQHYEDLDWIEVEDFELQFLSVDDRKSFIQKYKQTKKRWIERRDELGSFVPINRRPEESSRTPIGVRDPPVHKKRAEFVPTLNSRAEVASLSSLKKARSRHDSTIGESAALNIDPTRLMVPNGRFPFQKSKSRISEHM